MQFTAIQLECSTLRPWHPYDAESLIKHANNPRIASNLRDGFPYPYLLSDAKKWLKMVGENRDDIILAIEVDGEAAGGIGLHGFKPEAIHLKAVMKEGKLMNEHLYALVKDQWFASSST